MFKTAMMCAASLGLFLMAACSTVPISAGQQKLITCKGVTNAMKAINVLDAEGAITDAQAVQIDVLLPVAEAECRDRTGFDLDVVERILVALIAIQSEAEEDDDNGDE